MANPDWGNKLMCRHCGARFYDMRRDPPVCPRCGTVYKSEKPHRGHDRPAPEKARPAPEPVVEAEAEDDDEDLGDEEADEIIEDEEDEIDDEDVTGVVESIGDDSEER